MFMFALPDVASPLLTLKVLGKFPWCQMNLYVYTIVSWLDLKVPEVKYTFSIFCYLVW